jgi:glycosyltransferase involved in cell wall biosynthesis
MLGTPVVNRTTRVIAYNRRVQRWLEDRFGSQHVSFIPNGVDVCRYRPSNDAARLSARKNLQLPLAGVLGLFVGRDARKKNLEAVLRFPRETYTLVTCGAERRGLPAGVVDLGAVPHESMPEIYAAVDFLIHAAVAEGFPVAVQEAMSAGLPVTLLWDHGYEDAVSRDAVLAADSLDALGLAAARLSVEANSRRDLGARARSYAEQHWNWDASVDGYLGLFRSAVDGATS